MSGETRYRKISLGELDAFPVVCEDCGLAVIDQKAHTRFHSILSGHAWALAILLTSHIGPNVHDKYDVKERVDRRKFDSWSADALAEVIAELEET